MHALSRVTRITAVLATLALGAACSSAPLSDSSAAGDEALTHGRRVPHGFRLGTAIAGFQVDMGCPTLAPQLCEDRRSDWYQWITTPRIEQNPLLYVSKDPPSYGPGFFELYEQDIARAQNELHNDALRMGLEWSRIFPEPTFGIDGYEDLRRAASPAALDYYHRVFASLRAHGLVPLVTINHYSLPLWIHDGNACNENIDTCAHRGWIDQDIIVPEIAKYAGFVAREFGGEVDQWATLNEPFSAVVLPSYLLPSAARSNPPGLYLHAHLAKKATTSMIVAHARMYDAVKANDTVDADGDGAPSFVGLVSAVADVAPLTGNARDAKAARDARYLLNDLFLTGVAQGLLDEAWDGHPVYRADLANRLDYLGINYYFRITVQGTIFPIPGLAGISPYLTFNPLTVKQDGRYPHGIYDVLHDMQKYGRPLVVTETGIDEAKTPEDGPFWFVNTLSWVLKAAAEGVDVRGFYAWSLTDNYEWNHGTNMKFGLYAVDPRDPTKARTRRPAGDVYGRIGAARTVPVDLAARYGAP
jgi:beta-galactosidase